MSGWHAHHVPLSRRRNRWSALAAALLLPLVACGTSTDEDTCAGIADRTACARGSIDPAPAQIQAPLPLGDATATVPLTVLGNDVHLLLSRDQPDRIVRIDQGGAPSEVLWRKDPLADHRRGQGHTAQCRDIDEDGDTDIIDVQYTLQGDLLTTYHETLRVDGELLSDTTTPIDGTSVPTQITEICGYPIAPVPHVTALQLTALLERAGFTAIEGDHAIGPTWTAMATINDNAYTFTLHQGDPDPNPTGNAEVCSLGTLNIDPELPANTHALLTEIADCTDN